MAEERQILLEIEVDKKGAQKQLEENAEQLERNKEELKELNKSYKKGEVDVAEYAKAKLQLTQKNKDLNSENRTLIKNLKTEDNSLNALRQNLSRLVQERNNVNQQTTEGAARFNKLQKEILETTDAIKAQEEAGGDFRRSVGNYQKALEGSILDTEVFGTSINGLVTKLKSFINPVTAIAAGLGVLATSYLKTSRGARDLRRATDRLETSFKLLGNRVGNLIGATKGKGPIDSFVDNALTNLLDRLIPGLGTASQAIATEVNKIQENLREIQLRETQSQTRLKGLLDEAEALRQIRDDERNSVEERLDANFKLTQLLQKRQEQRLGFLEKEKKEVNDLINILGKEPELLQRVADLNLEIADIKEETRGFESEALANDLALFRETNEDRLALLTARINEEIILTEEGSRERLELEEKLLNEQLKVQLEAVGENEARKNTVIQEFLNNRLNLYKTFQDNLFQLQRINNNEEVEGIKVVKREVLKVDQEKTKQQIANIEAQIEAEKFKNDTMVQGVGAAFGALSGLFEEQTAAYKTFASIQAAIATYGAINQALATPPGPPATIPFAVAAGIQGFANVAKINGLFGGGGGASAGGGATQSAPRITRTALDGSFDRNQLTSSANNAQADRDNVSNSIANMPQQVVKVTDINKKQKQKSQVKVSGSL